jgi:hypothetical protein
MVQQGSTLTNLSELKSSIPKVPSSQQTSASQDQIVVPKEPFYVAPLLHFVTEGSIDDIKMNIDKELSTRRGISFEFFPGKCRWVAVFLVGSVRSKFEICVYKRSSGGFIVEGNRFSGESAPFVESYQAIRTHLTEKVVDETPAEVFPNPGTIEASHEEIQTAIDNILSMANSGVGEAQLGAAQIFCDIFTQLDAVPHIEKMKECLMALIDLVQVDFEYCNQHAICALAHLSSSRTYQEYLSGDENFLKTLLSLCTDGNCDSIEMRRECARLLANICSGGSSGALRVVNCAGAENVETWLRGVDGLQDERLRLHADRAKHSLSKCIAI